jgi:dephospho-CoA kinase
MISLGLTGGIGMGKTAAAEILARRGLPVVDTDQLARDLVAPGQSVLAEIRAAFGPEVLALDGSLDRKVMAERIFREVPARQQLEAILHPRIRAAWRERFDAWSRAGEGLAVVVIPLLFEVGAEAELDVTVCVACSVATQRQRLLARGWSDAQIAARLAAQWPAEKKLARAHYGVWNEGGLDSLAAQLTRILGLLDCAGRQPGQMRI